MPNKPKPKGEAPEPMSRGGRRSRHPNSLANLQGHSWKPGQSGNPDGKSKSLNDLMRLARSYAPEAIERLRAIMMDPATANRDVIQAATVILERGLGKPVAMVLRSDNLLSDSDPGGDENAATALLRAVREDTMESIQAIVATKKGETNGPGNLN